MIMDRKELEQAIADKLNEIADLFGCFAGYDASDLCIGISKDNVWGYVCNRDDTVNGPKPVDFYKERKHRKADRIFTPELGEIIGKTAKECLMNNDDNPLCWASDEGVELLRQKLVFRLQEHDLLLDLKESGTRVVIERVGEQ